MRRFWVDVVPGDGAINRKFKMLKIAGRYRLGAEAKYTGYKKAVAKAASLLQPLHGFVRVRLVFHTARRSGLVCPDDGELYSVDSRHIARVDAAHTSLMDVDASVKATLDGLVDGGLIKDDVAVVELEVRKRIAMRDAEGVSVEVSRLDTGTLRTHAHGVDRVAVYRELRSHLPAISFPDVDFATVSELESALEWARDPEQGTGDCPMWCHPYLEGAPSCDA